MDLSCFGIELETCVCDTSNKSVKFNIKKYRDRLQDINDNLGIGGKFEYAYNPESTNYGVWMATTDPSIQCGLSDSTFLTSNRPVTKSVDCISDGIELVSPKTVYTKDEYSKFTRILNEVVLHETFEYDINKSQGMHINVSHPDQDKLRMLKAWWYFEPVILTLVPPERRRNKFAIPVRERFKKITSLINNWETFYADPDKSPAKFTALCVKPNRFEVRIIQSTMVTHHITAWLTFCIRFLFASIAKSVDFDFTSIPTIEDLFDFVDVDASNPVDSLREYFYSMDTVRSGRSIRALINSYSMLELIKSGDEAIFIQLAAKSPDTMLTVLEGCIPIIPSLNLLKFFHILLTRYFKMDRTTTESTFRNPDIVKDYIAEVFEENNTSIIRAYDPAFYKEYVDLADHDLAFEILKTAFTHEDRETVTTVSRIKSCMITWTDILKFNSEWMVDCYENPLPPTASDIAGIKTWRVAQRILSRFPGIAYTIPKAWIELDIITDQFELISASNDPNHYNGFISYIIDAVCGNSSSIPKLLPILSRIINVFYNDTRSRGSKAVLTQYINNLFMCKNAVVNSFINSRFLCDNVELCEIIIHTLFKNVIPYGGDTSSELINDCLRVIPRERIIGKYKMIDEILSL